MSLFSANRTSHMTIVGQTGFGKTAFLHNLIMEDIQEGRTSIIIDPHGDLAQDVLESVPFPYDEHVYTLEVSEDMPFGLNLYECNNRSQLAIDRVVDNSILVFKRLMQSERDFHPHIEYLLRSTAYTILSNPTITMAEVGLMFAQSEVGKTFRSHLLRQINNTNIREFWQGVERRTGNIAYQYIEPLLNKVSPFTTSEVMRMIVGQEHTTIPFSEFLDVPGKTLIVNLPIGVLGEEKTQMLGMTFLSMLSEQIYERVNQRKASRVPLHLYIDEAGLFFSSGTAIGKLLKQGRKFGCATHLSFQTLSDLPDREAQSAVLQTGTLVFFQVIGGTDAEILSKQLQVKQPPVEQVPRMRMEPRYNEWDESTWTDTKAEHSYNNAWGEAYEEMLQTAHAEKRLYYLEEALELALYANDHNSGLPVNGVQIREVQQLIDGQPPLYKGYSQYYDDYGKHMWDEIFLPSDAYMKNVGFPLTVAVIPQIRFIRSVAHRLPDIMKELEMVLYPYYQRTVTSKTQTFPTVVAWLRNKAKQMMEAYKSEDAYWSTKLRTIREEQQRLYDTYYVTVHHKEQDGWTSVKTEEVRATTQVPNYSRRGPAYFQGSSLIQREQQIYDMVDGTPRPFSDLWNELQAILANLPPYYYYMQTINENKEIIESQQRSAAPPQAQDYGQEQAEEIRTRSLTKFGRPAEVVRKNLTDRVAPFLSQPEKPDPEVPTENNQPRQQRSRTKRLEI